MAKAITETYKLYGGEVELIFYPKSHQYKVAGAKVPSVTGVTGVLDKPALVQWAANECAEYLRQMLPQGVPLSEAEVAEFAEKMRYEFRRISAKAADIGTLVHDYAERYAHWTLGEAEEPALPEHPKVRAGVDAFRQWLDEHHVEFLYAERRVYSREHRYAGTVDMVGRVNGVVTLVDYKTSKAWYPEYALQVALYRNALEEEGVEIERSRGLRFDKETGEPEEIRLDTHESDLAAALACLQMRKWVDATRGERK